MNQAIYPNTYLQSSFPHVYDGKYREDIFHSIARRLDGMIAHHNKVLVIRLDIRFPVGYVHDGRNTELSFFLRRLRENIEYGSCEVHYVWAREQHESPVPHYHLILMLDGAKIQDPMGILVEADRIWAYTVGFAGTGLVHFCQQNGGVGHVMIRRPSSVAQGADLLTQQRQFADAYYTALAKGTYLAKTQTKGLTPSQTRVHGGSQMS